VKDLEQADESINDIHSNQKAHEGKAAPAHGDIQKQPRPSCRATEWQIEREINDQGLKPSTDK
jgi:hypothetical protein